MWELTPPTKTICKMNAIQMCMVWGRKHNCRHPSPRLVWDEGSESPAAATNSLSSMLPRQMPRMQILVVYASSQGTPRPRNLTKCGLAPRSLYISGPGSPARASGKEREGGSRGSSRHDTTVPGRSAIGRVPEAQHHKPDQQGKNSPEWVTGRLTRSPHDFLADAKPP